MRRLAAAVLVLCSGCGASMVETRKRMDGPVKEVGVIDAGGGHLKYPLRGPGFAVRARRRDAFAQMARLCGGTDRFSIVDEVRREEAEAAYRNEELDETVTRGGKHFDVAPYQHVFFECAR